MAKVIRINNDNTVQLLDMTMKDIRHTFSWYSVRNYANGLSIVEEDGIPEDDFPDATFQTNHIYEALTNNEDMFKTHFFIIRQNDVDELIDVDDFDVQDILTVLEAKGIDYEIEI